MLNKEDENILWHTHHVSKNERAKIKGQKPCVVWFTGLSGSGKSTIANAVESRLHKLNKHTYLLDGDNIRLGLNQDLSFSDADRVENIRRIGEVSKLFVDAGMIVLTAFISPFEEDRNRVREMMQDGEFIEVYVDTPLEVCEIRDPKGLYKKVRKGEIAEFTGVSSPYEKPQKAELHIKTENISVTAASEKVLEYLERKGYLKC